MALILHNHSGNIISRKPTRIDQVFPGSVVQFRYNAINARDQKPMVFVLFEKQRARGRGGRSTKLKKSGTLSAINLHYLTDFEIDKLFEEQNFLKLKYWSLYRKAFRTYNISDMQTLKAVDFKSNKQLKEERIDNKPRQPKKPEGGINEN